MKGNTNSFIVATSQYRSSIMGMSMLSIMLLHQCFTSVVPFNIFHNFGNWGVDVFLFLSGMGMVNSLEKNTLKEFYKRRFVRIVPSCFLCGSLKYIIFYLIGSSMFVLKEGLHFGIWSISSFDLWFIHTIIILYIIALLLHYMIEKWLSITIITILALFIINGIIIRPDVGYDWFSLLGIFSWTVDRLAVFFLGMLIVIKKRKININYSFSAFFLIAAICFKLLGKIDNDFSVFRACEFLALTISMPLLILSNIFVLERIHLICLKSFSYLGTYSFELYLIHEFIFWSIKIYFENVNPFCLLLISFIISFLVAFLCKKLVNRLLLLT